MLTALEKFGLVCIFIVAIQIARQLFYLLYNFSALTVGVGSVDLRQFGKGRWAVITGATDGIGKAYAEDLAKHGMNVILISRTLEKLQTTANDIHSKYNVETKVIVANFLDVDGVYYAIDKQLNGLDIAVLVNNVGMSYVHPEYFLEVPDRGAIFAALINCNIQSVTRMCRLVMPGMLERRNGIIINVSSVSAQIPSPLLTVYAATKAYVDKFSADLAIEYGDKGIIVQCVLPGYVATKMSKIKSATWMAPSPKQYVASAQRTVGLLARTTGYLPHALLAIVVHTLYSFSPTFSNWITVRTMENIRSRALKRLTPRRTSTTTRY